ncbi:MAG TPA: M48 family metalloprotease [Kiritimatiellia bacterium]|jgi:predicted Zn-dependent protease|nr:M48 family metalloprotease [Kiritimatiellia bacterium]HPC49346.1 M48 family metalloprotease [Kiritimatiellia bacterium]HPK38098.1 M48 family metalloprotease [Kiritimatiellia bacterium]HPW75112.1 M48 family metalloprotease [Kiritimatiellia bacterium]HRU18853.1 M48 family metalloprotease [Kiritimatiellia bacterium]
MNVRKAWWWSVLGRAGGLIVLGVGLVSPTGCVTNPITGKQQISLVGKSELISLSQQAVPSQFSSDYGVVSDAQLNAYVAQVGRRLVATLKPSDVVFPDMPFSFQVVNAVYVNAYAFPDGTIAITRGMLAELENEAQLAAVLGHEIAHVNCGHTASAMSKGTVYDALVSGTQGYLASRGSAWTDLAGTAGQLGSAVVLASYSREQERQADQGGMLYLVRAGYDPQGMVDLMRLLIRISGSNPSMIEQMFSSHPMSTERLETAETRLREEYAGQNVGVVNQAAFLAATASIRKNRAAFQHFAAAEALLAQKQAAAAKTRAEQGLRIAPNDYVGLMLVAQAERQSGQIGAAQQTALRAVRLYPAGARAHGMLAQCALQKKEYAAAVAHLQVFERQVPGEPHTSFYKGLAYEGMGRKPQAAQAYRAFVRRSGTQSRAAQYATQRLQHLTGMP